MKNIKFYSRVLRFRREGNQYYTMSPYAKLIRMNATAYYILLFCKDIHTSNELSKKVEERFNLSKEEAEVEIQKFLELMFKCGLLAKDETE